MNKASSGSRADRGRQTAKAASLAYSLPRGEFVRLDDAVNYTLLSLRPDQRKAAGVFEQTASIARPGAILFGVKGGADREIALILKFEEKLSQAAFRGEVLFKGAKVPPDTGDSFDRIVGATELEWIPSSVFGGTRGFDAETCTITFVSYYADDADTDDLIRSRLQRSDAFAEWTGVIVEREGYLKWLDREYPTVRGCPPKLGEAGVAEMLRAEKQKRGGEPVGQEEAVRIVRSAGYRDPRGTVREVAKRVAGNRGPGRPRKSA